MVALAELAGIGLEIRQRVVTLGPAVRLQLPSPMAWALSLVQQQRCPRPGFGGQEVSLPAVSLLV